MISVIIPTWNRAQTIKAAIQSVLDQSFFIDEILVCDDGSTDETEEIVRCYDARVRWLAGSHSGRPAIARNRGIRNTKGEWIAFLDSDDRWHPEKIASQLAIMRKFGCFASCTNAFRIAQNWNAKDLLINYEGNFVGIKKLIEENVIVCSSVVVHRKVLEDANFFPEQRELRALEDYALWLRIASRTPIAFLSNPLVYYHDDPKDSIRKDDVDVNTQKILVFNDFQEWLRQKPKLNRLKLLVMLTKSICQLKNIKLSLLKKL